ncbi:MAG: GumC family protein, partial [Fidelibacterota bacterium]
MNEITEERQVTLSDYLRILYRGRWIIAISFFAVVLSTVYYSFTAQPIYKASTKIMIQEKAGMEQSIFQVPTLIGGRMLVNNQIEYLKSRTLAESVIKALMNSEYKDSLFVLGTREAGRKGFNLNLRARIKGLINLVLFREVEEEGEISEEERIRFLADDLQKSVEINPIRDTDAIEIKVSAPDKFEAALIANTIAREYYNQNLSYSRGEITEVKNFLKEQLEKVSKNLYEAEEALKKYQEENKVASLSEETNELIKQIAEFETMYNEANTNLKTTFTRLEYVKNQLSDKEKRLVEDVIQISNPFIKALRDSIAMGEVRIAALLASPEYYPEHPGIVQIKNRIKELENRLVEETKKIMTQGLSLADPIGYSQQLLVEVLNLEANVVTYSSRVKALKKIVDRYGEKLELLPEKNLTLARLERDRKVNENLFLLMRTKFEESRITEAGQIGIVRIIDEAIPPKWPISPRKKLNLILGALVGLGLGIGITFLLEYMD